MLENYLLILKTVLGDIQFYGLILFFSIIIYPFLLFVRRIENRKLCRMDYISLFFYSLITSFITFLLSLFLYSKDLLLFLNWISIDKLAAIGTALAGIGSILNVLLSRKSLGLANKSSTQLKYSSILSIESKIFPKIEINRIDYNQRQKLLNIEFHFFEDLHDFKIAISENNTKILPGDKVYANIAHRSIKDETIELKQENMFIPHIIYKEISSDILDNNPAYINLKIPFENINKFKLIIFFTSKYQSDYVDVYEINKIETEYSIKLILRELPWIDGTWFDSKNYKEIFVVDDVVKVKLIGNKLYEELISKMKKN